MAPEKHSDHVIQWFSDTVFLKMELLYFFLSLKQNLHRNPAVKIKASLLQKRNTDSIFFLLLLNRCPSPYLHLTTGSWNTSLVEQMCSISLCHWTLLDLVPSLRSQGWLWGVPGLATNNASHWIYYDFQNFLPNNGT